MDDNSLTTYQKASRINLDALRHGAFAEIGAGQEVVRWFFHVGGAAGTVAKTASAYDMAISDASYGPTDRYVSRERLTAMLDKEFASLVQILGPKRGDATAFFTFADTMAARSYSRHEDGHGWMGIRFQHEPRAETSEIIIHVRMLDRENAREQEAIGVIGVNLIHGAFYHHAEPPRLIGHLLDNLSPGRVEVDLIRFSGPCFSSTDNRLMSLQLVEQGLTDAAMFAAHGEVILPADFLYKKCVLVERGSFRPVTKATLNMLERARLQFAAATAERGGGVAVLMEMSLGDLLSEGRVDHADFLARSDVLGALDQTVMISDYGPYHPVAACLRRHTKLPIAFVMGVPSLLELFQEKYYSDLPGGILESFGRLFNGAVTIYVCPTRALQSGELTTLDNLPIPSGVRSLYAYLIEEGRLRALEGYDAELLRVLPGDVLAMIRNGDATWETMVPNAAAETIKKHRLFGLV